MNIWHLFNMQEQNSKRHSEYRTSTIPPGTDAFSCVWPWITGGIQPVGSFLSVVNTGGNCGQSLWHHCRLVWPQETRTGQRSGCRADQKWSCTNRHQKEISWKILISCSINQKWTLTKPEMTHCWRVLLTSYTSLMLNLNLKSEVKAVFFFTRNWYLPVFNYTFHQIVSEIKEFRKAVKQITELD